MHQNASAYSCIHPASDPVRWSLIPTAGDLAFPLRIRQWSGSLPDLPGVQTSRSGLRASLLVPPQPVRPYTMEYDRIPRARVAVSPLCHGFVMPSPSRARVGLSLKIPYLFPNCVS